MCFTTGSREEFIRTDIKLSHSHRAVADDWTHVLSKLFQDKLRNQMEDLSKDTMQAKREQKVRLQNIVNEYTNKISRVVKKWLNVRNAKKSLSGESVNWEGRLSNAKLRNERLERELEQLEQQFESMRVNGEALLKEERLKTEKLKRDILSERTRESLLREQIERAKIDLRQAKQDISGAK